MFQAKSIKVKIQDPHHAKEIAKELGSSQNREAQAPDETGADANQENVPSDGESSFKSSSEASEEVNLLSVLPCMGGFLELSKYRSPIHTAKSTASSPELLGVMLLVWLPQDADMNICETVRGAMKALSRHPIQRGSEDALWAAIKVEWKRLAQVIL
ncbi:hypothetical protein HPB51_013357 [Rhipicephalus microplus]|uniref:Uncharacterized protein n=1 Tax=Rhipicephalus microplus TaxID=6941 RepID=A0A9J6EGR9_RHIMP|nr:hypothetical protein HPB51_013357 [Rhipicephalus microplus]